jgi:hypothetical protein
MANFLQRLFTRSRRATEVLHGDQVPVRDRDLEPETAPAETTTTAAETEVEPGGDLEVAVPDEQKSASDLASPADTPAADLHGGANETTSAAGTDAALGEPLPPASALTDDDAPSLAPASATTPDATWTVTRLREEAKARGIAGYSRMPKADLLAVLSK